MVSEGHRQAMYPLFGGIPGGPELLVLLLMLGFTVVAIAVGAGLFLFGRWTAGSGNDGSDDAGGEGIAELQARVDELESRLETERSDGTGNGDDDS